MISSPLVVTASTVKDTLANVERFVDGNLAGGADHLVLFLDAPDDPATPDVRGFLDAHPHVTCVVTDDTWWTDKRPEQLNTRQRMPCSSSYPVSDSIASAIVPERTLPYPNLA